MLYDQNIIQNVSQNVILWCSLRKYRLRKHKFEQQSTLDETTAAPVKFLSWPETGPVQTKPDPTGEQIVQ